MDEPPASPVIFDADGLPRSRRYGDVYFSREGGLAESRAVFLAGCGLPGRWSGRRRFTVGELGFGTGLNILALLELWRDHRPPGGHLSIFSVEAEPLSADEARRALGAWPELAPAAAPLLARWPGRRSGFHRVALPEYDATLDLAMMDADAALGAWSGHADAWFFDGFAPAVNPAMWSDELMALVAARSAPGAVAATYTVAGQARRALAAAGFSLERRPGFGAKRERLEATLPGAPPPDPAAPRIAIIGAGIAGAALALAFRAHGCEPRVIEAERAGAGASGNLAALVTPRLDAGLAAPAQLHAQAFDHAARLFERLGGAVLARGVIQLEAGPRDAARFGKIAASDLFEPGAVAFWDEARVSAVLGEAAPPGLRLATAPLIDPAIVLEAWAPRVEIATVARLEYECGAWRLHGADGCGLGEADIVCLATGADLARLWPEAPIQLVRGQLSFAPGVDAPIVAGSAYVGPAAGGAVFGATYDRDDDSAEWRPADDLRNLATIGALLPGLASRLARAEISGRASVRAATPDQQPLAGWIAPGLLVLGALGSRGFTLAPLLAEHLAALALGLPSPLPAALAGVVSPDRFALRARRRGLVGGPARV
jgi:tRNA 5-methylaminomethyl-2-thiouridine biosynthesis bifunctional protein